ncbi:TniQ family protein [Paraglaciecola mesophila]|nr:TniQ family protein [Paraglaciecola mesophila]
MTVMHSELPIRPRPQEDEMLLGYILRVAHQNGYHSVQTVRRLFSLKSTDLHSINSHFLRFKDLLSELSVLVRVDYEVLELNFENEMGGLYNSERAVQDISTFEVNVCLICMHEQKAMHKDWRIAHVTHCHIHQCELTSRCPNCDAFLNWKPSLYSHCEGCKIGWDEVVVEKKEIPDYQLQHMKLAAPQRYVYWHQLYKMAALAMRLYDAQLTPFRTFPPDIKCHQTLFSFCLRMLEDIAFREEQLANRVKHWKESGELKFLSDNFFAALNYQYQQGSPFTISQTNSSDPHPDVQLFQTKKIWKARRILANDELSYSGHLNVGTLARCIQRPISDISSMVKNGVLQTFEQSNMPRDYWFNLIDVDALFGTIHSKIQQRELSGEAFNIITLEEAVQLVRRNNWGLADIISLIIDGRCEVFVRNKKEQFHLFNICINREQLILALDEFFQRDKNCVKPSKIETFFYANEIHRIHLIRLINEQFVEPEDGEVLSPKKIERFLERYIVLNRWCKLRKLPIPKAIATLSKQQIFPVLHSKSGKGFYIFKRDSNVESLLFGCLADSANSSITH